MTVSQPSIGTPIDSEFSANENLVIKEKGDQKKDFKVFEPHNQNLHSPDGCHSVFGNRLAGIDTLVTLQSSADVGFETEAPHEYNLLTGAKSEVTSSDSDD